METPAHIFSQASDYNRDSDDYAADWEEYRRLRRKFFLIWLGYVPAMAAVAAVVQVLFHTFVPAFIAAFGYMIWWVAAGIEFAQFPCPRCGETFARKPGSWRWNWAFLAWKCQNCGLKKFARSNQNLAKEKNIAIP